MSKVRKTRKTVWMPITVMIALSLSAVTVLAADDSPSTHELTIPVAPPAGGPKSTEDSPSAIRQIAPDNSFDIAGDATRRAEVELKVGFHDKCVANVNAAAHVTDKPTAIAECERALKESNTFGAEAGDIRVQQRVMAEVSRVSDVTAVGAIGAAAYAQFGKRDPTQSEAMRGAADIQEVAGYAAYAAGATDFSMGAYAYVQQRRRLEEMQDTLKKFNAPSSVVSKLNAAAEKTKQAAYNHMLFGAGKAAVGYASMYMAKENRKQADSLDTYDESTISTSGSVVTATATSTSVAAANTGGVGAAVHNNNQPYFSAASTNTSSATSSSTGTTVASSGSSMMPGLGASGRSLASGGGLGGGGGGGGGFGGGGAGGSGASSSGDAPAAAEEDTTAKAPAAGGAEVSLLGGGARFGGGGKSSGTGTSEADALSGMSSLLTGAAGDKATGTGINANQVFRDAMSAEGGDLEQSGEAGVNGGPRSLFEVIRTRYSKVVQGGLVVGPGVVEVRN